ncbi:sensor histidine kinase [Flagellimonas allohymeniacidonis]|uniref:sensor histidine kinase n=1 Tax=Flagellimonas allohymeniacidonis TaxID=2517819 RepID=UPI0013EE4361|nr:sensor histidine kinase [Allomuricauda hymeniacidonis]
MIQFFKDGNDQSLFLLFLENLKRVPAMLLAVYGFNYYLVPSFYQKRRYLFFALGAFILFYFASAFDRIVNVYLYEPLFRKGPFVQETVSEIFSDVEFLLFGYLPALLTATFAMTLTKMAYEKNEMERERLQLQSDKNQAELDALKSQIHPHFLFNTLNNLYALTVQKSDKAPKMVESLSGMLDYILYQCNEKYVPLENEIELIKNYIELEKIRFGDGIELDCRFDFDRSKYKELKIAPLLLLSIVENAFKHGASGQIRNPKVDIHLYLEKENLFFEVKNTKEINKLPDHTGFTKGIGVANLKQQLQRLYKDYSFESNDLGDMYEVRLRLNTSSSND